MTPTPPGAAHISSSPTPARRRRRRLVLLVLALLLAAGALGAFWFWASYREWRTGQRLWPWSAYASCGTSAPQALPSTVRVGLYEEYPNPWRLDKLRQLDFPVTLAIAAPSRAEFEQLRTTIQQTYPQVREVVFWPTLRQEEGYYPGAWSDPAAVQRVAAEAEGLPVLWDLEVPLGQPELRLANWRQNLPFLRGWFAQRQQPTHIWRSHTGMGLDPLFLEWAGMQFDPLDYPTLNLHLDMYAAGAAPEAEVARILRCGVERYGAHFVPALGVLNDGEGAPELFAPAATIRRNLGLARQAGVSEVWLFQANGLNAEYLKALHESLPLEKLPPAAQQAPPTMEPLREVARWQTASVNALAVSPDGQLIAAGSGDQQVRIWQRSDGALLQTLQGHGASITSLAWSPDGQTLASGSWDKTLRLWRVADGSLLRTIDAAMGDVRSLAWSPDGQRIVAGLGDATVRVWSVGDGALLQTLTGHSGGVFSVAVAPDGQTIAGGSDDATITLWNANDGALRHTLHGHAGEVWSLAFAPDGQTLASGASDGMVKLWNIGAGELTETLGYARGTLRGLAFAPDGQRIAAVADDGALYLWQGRAAVPVATMALGDHPVSAVVWLPDGSELVTGGEDGSVRRWSFGE